MSGLMLCGKQSETPYYIENDNLNVYSLEEINYYLYNRMHTVTADLFSDSFFDYIEKGLDRADIAKGLKMLKMRGGKIKDFIAYIFKESNYYSQREVEQVSWLLVKIDSLLVPERKKIEGDFLFKEKRYGEAADVYKDILKKAKKGAEDAPFYAKVAYAVGTVYARLYLGKAANYYFSYAYELNPEPKYAKACIYMGILTGDDEELLKSIVAYKVPDESLTSIRNAISSARADIENAEMTRDFEKTFEKDNNAHIFIEKWKEQYYNVAVS